MMGFFQKLKDIFSDAKNQIYFELSFDENLNMIKLIASQDIKRDEKIVELIDLYNMPLVDNTILLGYEEIYSLYYDDRGYPDNTYNFFNLPPLFNGYMAIENKGNFVQDENVLYQFYFEDPHGKYLIVKNNVIRCEATGEYRILPRKIFELVKELIKYNSDSLKFSNVADQFEMLKIIKDYAQEVNIILSQRLSEEETPIIIDSIKIDFFDDGNSIEVFPVLSADVNTNNELINKIYNQEEIKDFYSATESGKKRKFIIKHKNTLKTIKENRIQKGENRLKFLKGENPLFEDENIDLSEFGPRVKGIGYLSYRSYPPEAKTQDLDWLEKEREAPHFILDEYKVILKPEDEEKLINKLAEMEGANVEVAECEFTDENGNKRITILTKDQIQNELQKLRASMIYPYEIKSKKLLEKILSEYDKFENQDYIEMNGLYIKNSSKADIEERLKELQADSSGISKEKSKGLLIYENLEQIEYQEENTNRVRLTHLIIPNGLKDNVKLFDYQKQALLRLQQLYSDNKINGFLLCDDMGLGKTLQLLAFLGWLKDIGELKPSLIVAPKTLLDNWDNPDGSGEIQKFFKPDYFKSMKIQGRVTSQDLETINEHDLVFITYESLRQNNLLLGKVKWQVIICDEAQKIKNPFTQVTVAAKGQNAKFKIICSATPIENSMIDLWNLVDFSKPGLLGSLKDFKKNYISKIEEGNEGSLRIVNDEISEKINSYYLRREKDILEKTLPDKKIRLYFRNCNQAEKGFLERLLKDNDIALATIQKLLWASSHKEIVTGNDISTLDINYLIAQSTKMQILREILDSIKAQNEKAIIFTRMKKMQEIIFRAIKYWYGFRPKNINGEISNLSERTKRIKEFKKSDGFDVIILSPDVAGFGITLTEANHVIHYTRMWNPAKEDQATDRVYRIGQEKEVTVHYPILSYEKNYVAEYTRVQDYVNDFLDPAGGYLSPEEKLNILLARKKNLLLNFFLAVESADINLERGFMELAGEGSQGRSAAVTLQDIDDGLIDGYEFEALVAQLYREQGYKVYVTTISNDYGVDVICLRDDKSLLVQCKKSKVVKKGEILRDLALAKETYLKQLGLKNVSMVLVTTAENVIDDDVLDFSIIGREQLRDWLKQYPVFPGQIRVLHQNRKSFEQLKYELK